MYLLADAYDGAFIQSCIEEFLCTSNGQQAVDIAFEDKKLTFGGDADLIAYAGHDGLMEFEVDIEYQAITSKPKGVIILACYSKEFFQTHIKSAQANPLVWTTHLMAPEAYTLKAAIDAFLKDARMEQKFGMPRLLGLLPSSYTVSKKGTTRS